MDTFYSNVSDYLSSDEEKHLHFVLARLGFENNAIKTNFVEALYKQYAGKLYYQDNYSRVLYRRLRGELAFKKAKISYDDPSNLPTMHDAPILEYVKDYNEINTNYINATDISSFVYCPASYCIKKTFNELPQPNKETVTGTEMHEQLRLAAYIPDERKKYQFTKITREPEFYTSQNKDFFDDIRSSSIYYIGHSDNPIRYFKSSKGDFRGQPDYIFTNDKGGNFIVEEKFKNYKNYISSLHSNHKAQLISYLAGLDTVNAEYGYLVYWYYTYEDNVRRIKKCVTHKFERNQIDREFIKDIFIKIRNLNSGLSLKFDTSKLDASKCANCIMRVFCGHKTGRFTEISMPYDKKYYTPIK